MTKEAFKNYRFNFDSQRRINQANRIIEAYIAQGFSLTLRQLYYQFVARGLMANEQRNYKSLGKLLSRARLAGLVDWKVLEDRTRALDGLFNEYASPRHFSDKWSQWYTVDLWQGQNSYVEVWVEKEALSGVVARPCKEWRVPYFCCRGYTSQSEQYKAGKRFKRKAAQGKTCYMLHLGDHDPSGVDMTRDNDERLDMFSDMGVDVTRLALNMDQVEELKPPPNPNKELDSRTTGYAEKYGDKSWELDALEPQYISDLINGAIEPLVDHDMMEARKQYETDGEDELDAISDNYEAVREFLRDEGHI